MSHLSHPLSWFLRFFYSKYSIKRFQQDSHEIVWKQNLPPQNLSLWDVNYFNLVNFWNTADKGKILKSKYELPFCKKHLHLQGKSPFVRMSPFLKPRRKWLSLWKCITGKAIDLSLLNQPSIQFTSVAHLCPTVCDLLDCRTPGFPLHH